MTNEWLIVCVHLINRPDQSWNEVGEGKSQGYLCDDCNAVPDLNSLPVSDLEPLAVESIDLLRGVRH